MVFPAWEIQSAVVAKVGRISDLSKDTMLQSIEDGDLRFLTVSRSTMHTWEVPPENEGAL